MACDNTSTYKSMYYIQTSIQNHQHVSIATHLICTWYNCERIFNHGTVFLHDLPSLHDFPALPQQNITVVKTKWCHKSDMTCLLQLIFCQCRALGPGSLVAKIGKVNIQPIGPTMENFLLWLPLQFRPKKLFIIDVKYLRQESAENGIFKFEQWVVQYVA